MPPPRARTNWKVKRRGFAPRAGGSRPRTPQSALVPLKNLCTVPDFAAYYCQQRIPDLFPDPFEKAGDQWRRSRARIAISKHVLIRTDECLDKTRRALESSLALLDRRVPSLIRIPEARAFVSRGSVRALQAVPAVPSSRVTMLN